MIKLIFIVYLYLIIQMCCVWIVYKVLKNPSVVDVSWSLGLMISGLIYLFSSPINLKHLTIALLLVIWGLRLAGYLWITRISKAHVDKRYLELSSNWKIAKSLGFFLNFQLQGFFIFILSIVFLFASISLINKFTIADILGFMFVLIGIIGETIADLTLHYFKQSNKGKLCNVGLWYYARHPNYFFELVVWIGFMCFGLNSALGVIGIISPFWLYIIFTKMTIPITERSSIKSRGQLYLDYMQSTSMLVPWFKW